MKSTKGSLIFSVAVAVSVMVVGVRGGPAEDFQKAYDDLDDTAKLAFNALGGPNDGGSFFKSLLNIIKCIQEKINPIDICNFNTSLDPFFYLQQCANGTLALEIIEKLMQNIPGVRVPVGIPPQISKDRCFNFAPSLPEVLTDLPSVLPFGIGK